MSDVTAWGAPQTNPLDNFFDQLANSWKVRLNHDYIVSPTIVNHATVSIDRYYNLGLNKTNGQGWDPKLGIAGIPADTGAFPQVNFSGGAVSPAQLNRAYDERWFDVRYSFIENLTWIHGKHTMKFGFEIDRDRIARYGVNVADINDIIDTAIGGKQASLVFQGQKSFGILVRFPESQRQDVERIHLPAVDGAHRGEGRAALPRAHPEARRDARQPRRRRHRRREAAFKTRSGDRQCSRT